MIEKDKNKLKHLLKKGAHWPENYDNGPQNYEDWPKNYDEWPQSWP